MQTKKAALPTQFSEEPEKLGHKVSHTVVGELLKKQKFSLQANSKTREGADNPDRDAQFGVINDAVKTAMAENQPAISVDTKKKELVGDSGTPGANGGRKVRRKKSACMTSSFPNSGVRFPTASTTSPTTPAG